MHEELTQALAAVAERLTTVALQDVELRSHLRRLASAILLATEETPQVEHQARTTTHEAVIEEPDTVTLPLPTEETAAAVPLVQRPASIEPTLAELAPHPVLAEELVAPAARWPDVPDTELPMIEARCRLKAEGARWAATRRQRIADGADFQVEVEPRDREIIERAKKLPDCFLWMNHPSGPSPSDLSLFEDVAGCFDAVASAVALVRSLLGEVDGQSGAFERALDLLAEAQSALRVSIVKIGGSPDTDQNKIFFWLRSAANQHQLFIQKFMRADDPADPTGWAEIGDRIQAVDSTLQEGRQRQKHHQQTLGRVRYHLAQLAKGNGDPQYHWNTVVQSIESLVQDRTPPSSTSIRELLLPVIESLPDMELPPGFRLVMREIDRFLATRPSGQPDETIVEVTREVKAVAEMLTGRTVVLIGGERRPHSYEALKTAFGLKDVDWIETVEHESITTFEPHIARSDVALVLLAIRWTSHMFGEVKQFCDRYDKPLVRLPAGYNPNQVAAQILSQVSGKLRVR